MRDRGDFERLTKKEVLLLTRRMDRLESLLGGIRHMPGLPDLLFVVDVRREETAIHEANLLNIPVVAMVDTNCDPRNIDYVIPSNDDAIRAIKLLVAKIADAVIEGKAMREEEEEVVPAPEMMRMVGAEEPELSDEELLGEATLAKLASAAAEEAEESEREEEIAEAEELEAVEAEEAEEAEEVEEVEAVEAEQVEEIADDAEEQGDEEPEEDDDQEEVDEEE